MTDLELKEMIKKASERSVEVRSNLLRKSQKKTKTEFGRKSVP